MDKMFSESRMRTRCDIFFNISLPQIKASIDKMRETADGAPVVKHIVAYSVELPEQYKKMLMTAADEYDFLVLDELVDGKPNIQPVDLAKEVLPSGEGVFATYNLDDDDVLSVSYFSKVGQYLKDFLAGYRVSLAAGYSAIWADGAAFDVRLKRIPFNNYGLATINKWDGGVLTAPPKSGHDTIDYKGPVVVDSTARGYLQLRHPDQDTTSALTTEQAIEKVKNQSKHLHPVKDMDEFLSEFPAIVEKFDANRE